ncbi:MAG: hypothetical protein K9G58_11935 [Bacteroidales bacterium]|nr:hypothetical protein [Bacteroidales bacterium]MCF8387131.1 hypothetical protein [Bacteroidales bacterium]MCF8398874.1 hypothetical protein [Bacteroidales bacterium]
MKQNFILITADHREKASSIPDQLKNKYFLTLEYKLLKSGDYLINNQFLIERKTNQDFIRSLIGNQLFEQCRKIKQSRLPSLLIIEGNPFHTNSKISSQAIKAALLAITASWQIPVFYSSDQKDTAHTILKLAKSSFYPRTMFLQREPKPKKIRSKQSFFVQGLPGISKTLSHQLLLEFQTIENLIKSDVKTLMKIRGIGKKKAETIYEFIHKKFTS